jgi:hypothetical protein
MNTSEKFLAYGILLLMVACKSDTQPATSPEMAATGPAEINPASIPRDSAVAAATIVSVEPPADLTTAEPALAAFIQHIIGYAQKRQLAKLLAVADDTIAISYGGGEYGKQEFKAFLQNPQQNGYARLIRALKLGGAPDDETPQGAPQYSFPYLQSTQYWKHIQGDEDVDPYGTFVGLSARVRIHEEPTAHSPICAVLRYPLLNVPPDSLPHTDTAGWNFVQTPDGKIRGYVPDSAVYNSADMKLVIAKKQGTFKILSVAPFD